MGNSVGRGRGATSGDAARKGPEIARSKSSARRVAASVAHKPGGSGVHSSNGDLKNAPTSLGRGVARLLGGPWRQAQGLLSGRRPGQEDALMGEECWKKRLESVYELQGVIGRGQSGIVSRVRHKSTGQVFACKTLVKQSMDSARSRLEAQREVRRPA